VIVPVERALCDFVYLNLREGIEPQHLVTFHNLDQLTWQRLQKTLPRYPQLIRNKVEQIVHRV
jgi:hypothetical protein